MIANWIHIAIVHFAVIGTFWLLYRTFRLKKIPLDSKAWKETYSASIIIGILATIAYFTGPEAADYLKTITKSYPQDLIEDHALWGRVAFVIQVITALIGIMGWASILQEEKPDKRILIILIALLTANSLIMVYTSHLGGQIRRLDLIL
jgi:hypothetical protein